MLLPKRSVTLSGCRACICIDIEVVSESGTKINAMKESFAPGQDKMWELQRHENCCVFYKVLGAPIPT